MLEFPDPVKQLRREFVRSGSDVIEALTYYAHREKLRSIGKEHLLEPLQRSALDLAFEVAAEFGHDPPLVAGNICNTNIWVDSVSDTEVCMMFDEQIAWPPASLYSPDMSRHYSLGSKENLRATTSVMWTGSDQPGTSVGGTNQAEIHVALLRGINVGGRNKLLMKALVGMFEDAGCTQVRTYIQSGNVIFKAPPALARRIPAAITEIISERVGFEIPVVTRTTAELRRIVRANPFQQAGVDEQMLHVAFLAGLPGRDRVATLDPNRSPPDEFVLREREIYLRCPQGLARSKLSNAYFDSKLATATTMRNWRTTLKLLELAGAGASALGRR